MPSMDEFTVIDEFFKSITSNRSNLVNQSIGDDAAIISLPFNSELLISTDTLVEGVHFLKDWPADVVAYKSLAASVSDIAAMAGQATWCSLALTLPKLDRVWLADFSKGFARALSQFNMDLIGGDMTQGPPTISITVHGLAPKGKAVKRSGAQIDDDIYITGTLGAPSYAVSQLRKVAYTSKIYQKLFYPTPQLRYADILQKFATSAIDISDGLSSDLSHILKASKVGATIQEVQLPLACHLETLVPNDEKCALMLNSGDEYELCFTVPHAYKKPFEKQLLESQLKCFHIGQITSELGLLLIDKSLNQKTIEANGFKHF